MCFILPQHFVSNTDLKSLIYHIFATSIRGFKPVPSSCMSHIRKYEKSTSWNNLNWGCLMVGWSSISQNENFLLMLKKIQPASGEKIIIELEEDNFDCRCFHAEKECLSPDQILVTCSFPAFAITNTSVPISDLLIGFISSSLFSSCQNWSHFSRSSSGFCSETLPDPPGLI